MKGTVITFVTVLILFVLALFFTVGGAVDIVGATDSITG